MPGKLLKKIIEENQKNENDCLSIIDQGINSILEIPELCKYLFSLESHFILYFLIISDT